MCATLLKPEHAPQAEALVHIEPAIDGIGVARLQEAMPGDRVRSLPIGDFQQGGTPFADIGPRVVVPVVDQILALAVGQG
jgi:hypothetical protein